MSYTFKVVKDADGVRVEAPQPQMLPYIPDGTYSISGHAYNGPGSSADSISVQLVGIDGRFAYAQGSTRPADVPKGGGDE